MELREAESVFCANQLHVRNRIEPSSAELGVFPIKVGRVIGQLSHAFQATKSKALESLYKGVFVAPIPSSELLTKRRIHQLDI
jgi:hypothetical protein